MRKIRPQSGTEPAVSKLSGRLKARPLSAAQQLPVASRRPISATSQLSAVKSATAYSRDSRMLTQIDEEVVPNGPAPVTSRAQPPELTNQESAKLNLFQELEQIKYECNVIEESNKLMQARILAKDRHKQKYEQMLLKMEKDQGFQFPDGSLSSLKTKLKLSRLQSEDPNILIIKRRVHDLGEEIEDMDRKTNQVHSTGKDELLNSLIN